MIKPATQATSAIGYIRLHGRNYQNWFAEHADVHEQYDFLYPAAVRVGMRPSVHVSLSGVVAVVEE